MTSCDSAPQRWWQVAGGGHQHRRRRTAPSRRRRSAQRRGASVGRCSMTSASRSIRSTVSTTSAVSDDAVLPCAAMATPTEAAARAGASLMPSPTMTVGPRCPRPGRRRPSRAGRSRRATASTPTRRPIDSAASARSPVTSTTRSSPAARSSAKHAVGVRAQGVSSAARRSVGTPSTPTKTVSAPSRLARRAARRSHAGDLARTHPVEPTDADRRVRPRCPRARSRVLTHVRRGEQGSRLVLGVRRRRWRRQAREVTPGRGWPPTAVLGASVSPPSVMTVVTTGCPTVRVPVLSNSSTRPSARCSSAPPPLTTAPLPCSLGEPRHDRDRGGEQQRARCRDDQDGHSTYRVSGHPPGRPGQEQGEGHEERGEPVGRPDEGCRRRLGLLHQSNDLAVGRLCRERRGDHLDRRSGVDDSRADLVTGRSLDRVCLAGQRRLVEVPRPAGVRRLGRPPRRHQQPVTTKHLLDRDEIELFATASTRVRGARATSIVSSRFARASARASSSRPVVSISVMMAPASGSSTRSVPSRASHATTSTPTCPARSPCTSQTVDSTRPKAVAAHQTPEQGSLAEQARPRHPWPAGRPTGRT